MKLIRGEDVENQARVYLRAFFDTLDQVGGHFTENRSEGGVTRCELLLVGRPAQIAAALQHGLDQARLTAARD